MKKYKNKTQNEKIEDFGAVDCFCWIFQLSTLGALIALIIFYFTNNRKFIMTGIIFGISYGIYIILEFCSSISIFLKNKSSIKKIHEVMRTYFRTPPKIIFSAECYHNEEVSYTTTDSQGREHHYTRTEKVVTYRDTYRLPYHSSKDISEVFKLKCDKDSKKKYFIKLDLKTKIDFADSISCGDYETEKQRFCSRN